MIWQGERKGTGRKDGGHGTEKTPERGPWDRPKRNIIEPDVDESPGTGDGGAEIRPDTGDGGAEE